METVKFARTCTGDDAASSDGLGANILNSADTKMKSASHSPKTVLEAVPFPKPDSRVSAEFPNEVYDPMQLYIQTKSSVRLRHDNVVESLKFNAVELTVEYAPFQRFGLQNPSSCFATVFNEGAVPGTWNMVDKSEVVQFAPRMKFIKRFRLRAGTDIDRDEKLKVAIINGQHLGNVTPRLSKAVGVAQFTASDILDTKEMITERELERSGSISRPPGKVVLALDILYHVKNDERITLDFGFMEGTPVRNRMFFIISRSLREGKWSPIYRSEVRHKEDIASYESVSFCSQEFNGGDASRLFRLELVRWYKNGKTKALGFLQTSLEKLKTMAVNGQLYWWPAQNGMTGVRVLIQNHSVSNDGSQFSLKIASTPVSPRKR